MTNVIWCSSDTTHAFTIDSPLHGFDEMMRFPVASEAIAKAEIDALNFELDIDLAGSELSARDFEWVRWYFGLRKMVWARTKQCEALAMVGTTK